MKFKSFTRRLQFRLFRLRRLGKLRLIVGFFVFAVAAAFHLSIATRLVNVQPDDSKLYIQLARNVIEQGVFSGESEAPYKPTLIRTPGYPFFLIAVYEINGPGNEIAVRVSQSLLFTLTCIFVAMIASQWMIDRRRKAKAAFIAFVLTAFCPFMVIYSATILAETLTMCFLAATILAATYALVARQKLRSFLWWATAGGLAGYNVLIRPDAGLFAFGIGLTLVVSVFFGRGVFRGRLVDRFLKGIVFTVVFALPLIPWTIRNERLFGVFQP
ncbi:MAG: glycosyltransferase family 39 protein, partial [Candidatus Binatia bacterium]